MPALSSETTKGSPAAKLAWMPAQRWSMRPAL